MGESIAFNWNNAAQEGVIIENSSTEETPEINLVPQKCEEVEVISTAHILEQNNFHEIPQENEIVEEVLEQWDGSCAEVIVGNDQEPLQDVEIPIPMDQDEYILSTPYPCDFCNKRFRKKVKYLKHMAAHQKMQKNYTSTQYYECSICGIRFFKQNELINHKKIHEMHTHPKIEMKVSNVDKGSFVCGLCGVGFSIQKALTSHMSIHEGDSPLACKQCEKTFWDMSSLEEHWQIVHASMGSHSAISKKRKNDGTYCCTICGLSFCRQNDLKRHQQNHENEEEENSEFEYICNICGESYNNTYDLELHTEQVHGDGFVYQCMICEENFLDEAAQLEHVQEQHPESEVLHRRTKGLTEETPKSRKRKGRANDGELFSGNSNSKIGDQPYSCEVCGKNFTTRSSQQIHLRIHTGERPYGCSFCHKAFTDGGTLRKHERIHTGEKPYACVICSKAFNQRVVLREHIRSHHSGPDPLYADSMTPYTCGVCTDMFSASQDLILHLIQHCDMNTAMKRLPRTGPRKYVRRKKLQPHEYDIQDDGSEEETCPVQQGATPKYEIDMDVRWTNMRYRPSKKSTKQAHIEKSPKITESLQTYAEPEIEMRAQHYHHLNNGSLSNVPRAKMIFTGKKHKLNEIYTKRHNNYKEKQCQEFSGNKENSKSQTKNIYRFSLKNDKPLDTISEDVRAVDNLLKLVHTEQSQPFEIEIQNLEVTVESRKIIETNSNETFDTQQSLEETVATSIRSEKLAEKNLQRNENAGGINVKEEYEEELVYENPEEYVICEENNDAEESTIAPSFEFQPEPYEKVVDRNTSVHEIMDPLLEFAEISMQHAKSLFKCEMCSAVFLEKGQLMAHVHVHI